MGIVLEGGINIEKKKELFICFSIIVCFIHNYIVGDENTTRNNSSC